MVHTIGTRQQDMVQVILMENYLTYKSTIQTDG